MMIGLSEERIKRLNSADVRDKEYVLYWMQSSQRVHCNMALAYAVSWANKLEKLLVVYFGLTRDFPEANLRHYVFMVEGLHEVEAQLADIGVKLVVQVQFPEKGVVALSKDACLTVVDKGYLKLLRQWYASAAANLRCPMVQVEDNVVIPVETASNKEEYSAATIRPKINRNRDQFLQMCPPGEPKKASLGLRFEGIDLADVDGVVSSLGVDASVGKAKGFQGGSIQAEKRLEDFLENKLPNYIDLRNDPTVDVTSNLSPYLHFGQISPVSVALQVLVADTPAEAKEAYLEELIVRRELATNYTYFNRDYDSFAGLPNWAKQTLEKHAVDVREYLYPLEELETAQTHDPYWNAAQNQMRLTGKMHGYMRMYWGKKILEWTKTPQDAFKTALHLNNKYEIDGRDPNGYTGVAWCFGKHDRPWKERPVFGMVRFMNANGLKRKFDADKYVKQVKQL
ncbi:MAG: deoxyribodipyrimidine photo-lyase [Candidatus Bathyarchaeota archaeon]|nr:deoxyribodipyrimidine photo-lyase [Candidatus Bathyarchaeota archaeon]